MKKRSLVKRTALGIIVFSLIILIGVALAGGIQMYRGNLELYTDVANSYVKTAAYSIQNADMIQDIMRAGDDFVRYFKTGEVAPSSSVQEEELQKLNDFWWTVMTALMTIKVMNEDIQYLYVIVPTEKDLIYLWDTDMTGEIITFPLSHAAYGENEKEIFIRAMNRPDTSDELVVWYDDESREIIGTAMHPIRDDNGNSVAVVAMDISMSIIRTGFIKMMINMGVVTGIILIAACIIYYLSVRKRMIIPLVTMKNAAAGLVDSLESNPEENVQIDVHTGDEIEEVARSFEEMEKRLKVYIRENEEAAAEKEQFATEMRLASRIQLGMLPDTSAVFSDRKEIDLSAAMETAKEVGGDFYDFFFVDDTHLALVIADVSGKGVPAALFMMMAKILIRNFAKTGISPGAVFEKVNASVFENNPQGLFVSVWLGVLDLKTGALRASNAGHEYPIIRHADGSVELYKDRHSFVIGPMRDMKYKEYEMTLLPGEGLYLYTDGVPEATNSRKEKFGNDRMVEALRKLSGSAPDQVLKGMEGSIRDFVKDAEQFDDITMLCFDYNGMETVNDDPGITANDDPGITLETVLENIPVAANYVIEKLKDVDCPRIIQKEMKIAVDEMFGNICRYAYEGKAGEASVKATVSEDGTSVSVTLTDAGIPFNPLERGAPDITLPREKRKPGGLGIYVVRKIMDDIIYEYNGEKNVLTMIKHWNKP